MSEPEQGSGDAEAERSVDDANTPNITSDETEHHELGTDDDRCDA
jgi:hypothetical protein